MTIAKRTVKVLWDLETAHSAQLLDGGWNVCLQRLKQELSRQQFSQCLEGLLLLTQWLLV